MAKKGKYDQVIVLSGDAPLITAETIRKLSDFHTTQKATMTLLSADLDNPYGYGRVIRKGAASKSRRLWKKSPRLRSRRKFARSIPDSMRSMRLRCTSTSIVFQPRTRTANTTSPIWRECFIGRARR